MGLENFTSDELLEEVKRRKEAKKRARKLDHLSPVGAWNVTTEGDCEGTSVRNLGVYQGHIVDIARALAHNSMYGLRFSPAKTPPNTDSGKPVKVNISLDIDSETWDMDGDSRKMAFRRFLGKEESNASYEVEEGKYYACVALSTFIDHPF